MTIKYWTSFAKRKNSTKQPTGGTQVNVNLKAGTSLEAPVFILTASDAFNIVYVEAFGHYYFVSDVRHVTNDTVEVSCSQDVLATYKSQIGATSAYILYDESTNVEIPDERLALETTPQLNTLSAAFRSDYSAAGSYIISITGTNKVGTYVVPESTLARLMPDITTVYDSYIQSSDPFGALVAGGKQLVGSGSLSENIRDVRWIPFSISNTSSETLRVGMYDIFSESGIPLGGLRINQRIVVKDVPVSIPWKWTGLDWRNSDPYTQISVYIPFIGNVSYPASVLKGRSSINFESSLDTFTGELTVRTYSGGVTLGTYGAQTGVQIPLGYSGVSAGNLVNGVIGAAASIATGSTAGLVTAALNACKPLSQSVGGIGSASASGLDQNIQISVITHEPVEAPSGVSSVMGTPSYEVKTISSLSGYVQCMDASVSISGPDADRDEINGYLNGGFFYE